MIPPFQNLIQTPASNTGSHRQDPHGQGFERKTVEENSAICTRIEAHLDFLTVCGNHPHLPSLEANVFAAFGTRFDWQSARPGTVGKFYGSNVRSPNGLMLSLNTDSSGQVIEFRLSISGKPLAHIKKDKLHEFGRYLLSIGANCTRFDWAIDDYSKTLDIDVIRDECERGNRHGFAEYSYYESGKKKHKQLGKTIYLGGFSSEYLSRIYDKSVESAGEIDAIRWESQARGDIANSCFHQYFGNSDLESAVAIMSKRSIGKYRFVEPVSEVLSRCPDLGWWGEFVSKVGGQIKVSVPRFQTMLSDKKRWIESQVAGTLSLIFKCMGVKKGAEWLFGAIQEKSREKEDYNQNYYDTWKERRKCDSEDYDFRVSRYAEEREYGCLLGQITDSILSLQRGLSPLFVKAWTSTCMSKFLVSEVPRSESVFPEILQLSLFALTDEF